MKGVYDINKALILQCIPHKIFLVSIWTMKDPFFLECTFMVMFFVMLINWQWMTAQKAK